MFGHLTELNAFFTFLAASTTSRTASIVDLPLLNLCCLFASPPAALTAACDDEKKKKKNMPLLMSTSLASFQWGAKYPAFGHALCISRSTRWYFSANTLSTSEGIPSGPGAFFFFRHRSAAASSTWVKSGISLSSGVVLSAGLFSWFG